MRPVIEHIGIEVHKRSCQVYVLTEGGELVERRIKTERAGLHALFGGRPRACILVESSTESEWVARCFEELDHQGVSVTRLSTSPLWAGRRDQFL